MLVFLKELDDLLGSELFAANWTELVGKISQAFEAGAMAAVKDAFFSLVVVVFFLTNVTLAEIVFCFFLNIFNKKYAEAINENEKLYIVECRKRGIYPAGRQTGGAPRGRERRCTRLA